MTLEGLQSTLVEIGELVTTTTIVGSAQMWTRWQSGREESTSKKG